MRVGARRILHCRICREKSVMTVDRGKDSPYINSYYSHNIYLFPAGGFIYPRAALL